MNLDGDHVAESVSQVASQQPAILVQSMSLEQHDEARQLLRICADGLVRDVDTAGDAELPDLAERAKQQIALARALLAEARARSAHADHAL